MTEASKQSEDFIETMIFIVQTSAFDDPDKNAELQKVKLAGVIQLKKVINSMIEAQVLDREKSEVVLKHLTSSCMDQHVSGSIEDSIVEIFESVIYNDLSNQENMEGLNSIIFRYIYEGLKSQDKITSAIGLKIIISIIKITANVDQMTELSITAHELIPNIVEYAITTLKDSFNNQDEAGAEMMVAVIFNCVMILNTSIDSVS